MKEYRSVAISTNIGCSISCSICPQNKIIKSYGTRIKLLTIELFVRILNKIPKDVAIHFSGFSEPYLNPLCTQMMKTAKENGYKIMLCTTTVGMNDDDLKYILKSGINRIQIHLADSMNNANIIVDKQYLNKLKALLSIQNCKLLYNCMGDIHPLLEPLFKNIPVKNLLKKEMISSRGGLVRGVNHPEKKGRIFCARGVHMMRNELLPDGRIALCCMDYGLQHIIGDLNKLQYEELFQTDAYLEVVQKHENDKLGTIICRNCEFAVSEHEPNNALPQVYYGS